MDIDKTDIEWLLMMIVMLAQKFPIDITIYINIGKQKAFQKAQTETQTSLIERQVVKERRRCLCFNVQILSYRKDFGNEKIFE